MAYNRLSKKHRKTLPLHEKDELHWQDNVIMKSRSPFCPSPFSNIPSMVDGLNDCQRVVLFHAFKLKLDCVSSVADFSHYIYTHSAYRHLDETIICMAQNFVGSNNINLFVPYCFFGSREQMCTVAEIFDTAMYTYLNPITRYLFPKDDDIALFEYDYPHSYVPVIPTVLVNGIKTGFGWESTFILLNYKPKDIIGNIRLLLDGKQVKRMLPHFEGYGGTFKILEKEGEVCYTCEGNIVSTGKSTVKITELPIDMWPKKYIKFLESLPFGAKEAEKDGFFIKWFKYNCCGDFVDIEVCLPEEFLSEATTEVLKEKFRLTSTFGASVVLLDSEGRKKKYDTPEHILLDFFHVRLSFYDKRKEALLSHLEKQAEKLGMKISHLETAKKDRAAETFKCRPLKSLLDGGAEAAETVGAKASCYDYNLLLREADKLKSDTLTQLKKDKLSLDGRIDELKGSKANSLWREDLRALEEQLDKKGKPEAKQTSNSSAMETDNAPEVAKLKVPSIESVPEAKETSNGSAVETDNATEVAKQKGRAAKERAPDRKQKASSDGVEDDEVLASKGRLASAYKRGDPYLDLSEEAIGTEGTTRQESRGRCSTERVLMMTSSEIVSSRAQGSGYPDNSHSPPHVPEISSHLEDSVPSVAKLNNEQPKQEIKLPQAVNQYPFATAPNYGFAFPGHLLGNQIVQSEGIGQQVDGSLVWPPPLVRDITNSFYNPPLVPQGLRVVLPPSQGGIASGVYHQAQAMAAGSAAIAAHPQMQLLSRTMAGSIEAMRSGSGVYHQQQPQHRAV